MFGGSSWVHVHFVSSWILYNNGTRKNYKFNIIKLYIFFILINIILIEFLYY